jgi:hypothetical protein
MSDWTEVEAAAGEVGTIIAGKFLLSKWIPAFKTIQWGGKLAWPAAAAGAVWLGVKPWGDDEIQRSWNAWRTATVKLQSIRINGDWADKVKAIQAAWPEGADRKAFDKFIGTVWEEMYQTEQAAASIGEAVQTAQTQIHQIMHTVGIVADLLLATIIAAEIAEAFAPTSAMAAAVKSTTAAVLMGVTITGAGSVVAALIYNLGNISALMSSDTRFPQPQPNRYSDSFTSDTDFKDIKVQNRHHKGGWTYQ